MNYVDAINQVLKHEGGFVNDPADSGGATNFGITRKVYESFKGRPVSIDEIKNMPKADAIAIYKRNYWDKIRGDQIKSYAVAFAIFDQAVNRSVSAAVKTAQKVVGSNQDGMIGPATLNLVNTFNEKQFLDRFLTESKNTYRAIASANAKNERFLQGWLNRVDSIGDYVGIKPAVAAGGLAVVLVAGFFLIMFVNSSKRKVA